jgi:hypothetical protein
VTPTPLLQLREHVERTQAVPDPAERDRALAVVEQELNTMLGMVRTYRNDTKLQLDQQPSQNGDGGNNDGRTA